MLLMVGIKVAKLKWCKFGGLYSVHGNVSLVTATSAVDQNEVYREMSY